MVCLAHMEVEPKHRLFTRFVQLGHLVFDQIHAEPIPATSDHFRAVVQLPPALLITPDNPDYFVADL